MIQWFSNLTKYCAEISSRKNLIDHVQCCFMNWITFILIYGIVWFTSERTCNGIICCCCYMSIKCRECCLMQWKIWDCNKLIKCYEYYLVWHKKTWKQYSRYIALKPDCYLAFVRFNLERLCVHWIVDEGLITIDEVLRVLLMATRNSKKNTKPQEDLIFNLV